MATVTKLAKVHYSGREYKPECGSVVTPGDDVTLTLDDVNCMSCLMGLDARGKHAAHVLKQIREKLGFKDSGPSMRDLLINAIKDE